MKRQTYSDRCYNGALTPERTASMVSVFMTLTKVKHDLFFGLLDIAAILFI